MKLKRSLLPLMYFQSHVVFVDDDKLLLNTLKLIFESDKFNANLDLFSDADSAREWISQHTESISAKCLDFEESHLGSRGFDILNQFSFFQGESNINCISLVIIDYAMPAKDGLTLAKELREVTPEIKILMLTGEADETMAINAFNNGLIDLFIKKESRDLAKLLLDASQRLVSQYFLDQTNMVLSNINPTEDYGLPDFLCDPAACEYILSQFPISSYQSFCLINEDRTFEIIFKDNSVCYFKLLSEDEYKNMLEDLRENSSDKLVIQNAEKKQSLIVREQSGNELVGSIKEIRVDGKTYYFSKIGPMFKDNN